MIDLDSKVRQVLTDPSTSYWLKDAIRELLRRDPLDAVRDAEVLLDVMQDKASQSLGIPRSSMVNMITDIELE